MVTADALIGKWLAEAGIKGIGSVVSLEPKWYSIRSVELFIKEVDAIISENPLYDKKVVVLFQFVKHFLPSNLLNVNLSEGLAQNSIFTLEGVPCNIQKILAKLKECSSDIDRAKIFGEIFQEGSENLYYLVLMNKLGYRLSKIVDTLKPADKQEKMSLILNEDPLDIRDRDFNEKLDRLVRRMYAMGRSDRTNLENAVLELEKVLDLGGDERESAFSDFLNKSYYEDFERVDNRTIFLLGISSFLSIFKSFLLYEKDSNYWLRLIDFYFNYSKITEIKADVVQCLNYCCIDDRKVFIDIVIKFNRLNIVGNLNKTKSYASFLRKYVTKIISLTGIRADYWGVLMANGIADEEIVVQFMDSATSIMSELDELRNDTVFDVIKEDCEVMHSFLDKNIKLIQSPIVQKEYEDNFSFHTEIHTPVMLIEEQIKKENLTGKKLDEFLASKYTCGSLKATEAKWLRKKFGDIDEGCGTTI